MKRSITPVLMLILVAAAAAAGYWWGTWKAEGGNPKAEGQTFAVTAAKGEPNRRILYYRNPMGLPDTSPVPKKDQMGMNYIPVYEGEEPESGGPLVKISTEKVQKLGVRTETAALRELTRIVRAVGTVQVDERRLYTVTPKFEGWIERLHVNTTGQYVTRGQPLMEVYSPDLVTAQQEYLIAWKGVEAVKEGSPEIQASMRQLVASALQRLRNWDISEEELTRLQKEGTARQSLTLRSPVNGVVLEKPALKGMRFMPGEMLYQISDLSSLWLLADIFEQDLALVRQGQAAKIMVNAYPGKAFDGKVAFVYPTLTAETRTAKARVELVNTGGLLKPAMYANVELLARRPQGKVLAVPDSAVLDTGTRQIVLVARGEGTFEPRAVKLGMSGDGYVEVLDGVTAGEVVVTSANFLIDSESNLKAALSTLSAPAAPSGKQATAQGTVTGAAPVHRAQGTVESVDHKAATLTFRHGEIPSLKWPPMTMDFRIEDRKLLKDVKPGQNLEIDLVQRAPGDFVITRIVPAGGKPAAAAEQRVR